jgi:hypothetical protein
LGRLFWRSAKERGEAAAEVIEQRAQIQKLALQVRKLDRERSALIRQIGAKVYSLHGKGKVRNQDVRVDCVRIDEIMENITKLHQEIEIIRAASLEKGLAVPIMSDDTPLDGEESSVPTAVTSAGTSGQQDLPEGGIPRASQGRVEYDEDGDVLVCEPGPSQPGDKATCEIEEIAQEGTAPMGQAEIVEGEEGKPTGPSLNPRE